MKSIIHVDMDAFFVSVERVLNPKLNGKPVIVGQISGKRGVVSAASYEARKLGVHSAMPMVQAKKLAPDAIYLTGSSAAYKLYSDRVMSILSRFTPAIEPVSIDEAYLDISGTERLFRARAFKLAETIRNTIAAETSLPCSIGCAGSRYMAKIATNCAKPAGILYIKPGYETAFLAPLEISAMPGVGPAAVEKYKRMGISKIGDLQKFRPELVKKVFGRHGQLFYNRAVAEENAVLQSSEVTAQVRQPKSVGNEVTYSIDSDDPERLEATLSYLSEKVAGRLRRAGLRFEQVTLKLRYSDFSTFTRSKTISFDAGDSSTIFATSRDLMKTLCAGRRQRVRLIGVTVSSLVTPARQLGLFENLSPQKTDLLEECFDSIRKRYGFETVLKARSSL